jgi:hydrogenase nickel incorporation protein HypB
MNVRRIDVRERVMARNDEIAAAVRGRLREHRVASVNLMSSPGAGKTLLLERTLQRLGGELAIAMVTADVQTENDAERLARHTDRLVHAVVTNGACHMDALQVTDALDQLDLAATDLVVLENVGNLVCPASWDLGEEARVVLFTTTEGEDKPVKYPKAFQKADLVVLTKTDLLPYLPFDLGKALEAVRAVNPDVPIIRTSSTTGEGLDDWCNWLRGRVAARRGSLTGATA